MLLLLSWPHCCPLQSVVVVVADDLDDLARLMISIIAVRLSLHSFAFDQLHLQLVLGSHASHVVAVVVVADLKF